MLYVKFWVFISYIARIASGFCHSKTAVTLYGAIFIKTNPRSKKESSLFKTREPIDPNCAGRCPSKSLVFKLEQPVIKNFEWYRRKGSCEAFLTWLFSRNRKIYRKKRYLLNYIWDGWWPITFTDNAIPGIFIFLFIRLDNAISFRLRKTCSDNGFPFWNFEFHWKNVTTDPVDVCGSFSRCLQLFLQVLTKLFQCFFQNCLVFSCSSLVLWSWRWSPVEDGHLQLAVLNSWEVFLSQLDFLHLRTFELKKTLC